MTIVTKFLNPDAIAGSEEHNDDCPLCDAQKKNKKWYDNPQKPDQWHDDKMTNFSKFKKDHDLDNKTFHESYKEHWQKMYDWFAKDNKKVKKKPVPKAKPTPKAKPLSSKQRRAIKPTTMYKPRPSDKPSKKKKKAYVLKLYDSDGCIYCKTNEIFKKRKVPTHKLVEEFRQSHHRALNSNPEFQKMSKEQRDEQLAAVEHDVKVYEIHGRKPDDVHAMIDHVRRERKIDDANKTVIKREFESSHHKCIGCGELRPKEDYTNPVGQSKGLCDHCNTAFLGAEDLKNTGLFEEDDLNEKGEPYTTSKAVMAVSSPKQGETCNCQHGDHANANGHQAGMYNQDLGRANWQGQGLPQPKQDKDSCQCDEKPAEADKVPNADARISDKDMKEEKKKHSGLVGHIKEPKEISISDLEEGGDGIYRPEKKKLTSRQIRARGKKHKKKFLNYSDEEIVEVDGKTTKRKKKKIKKMTPAQLEARKKKKPYRQDDLRRRKYRDKKRISATRGKNRMGIVYISDLEEGGDGILREGKLGRNAALSHGQKVGHKRRREAKERKVREGMEALDKKIKALANIIKRNKKYKPELFIGDLDEEGKVTDATRLDNIRAAKRHKRKLPPRTVNEHEGKQAKWQVRAGMEALGKKLKALEDIMKKKKKGRKRGAGKKWMKGLTWTKPSAPKPVVEAGQAGGDVVTAPVKPKKQVVEEGRAKIETADEKASKLNRQAMERIINPYKKRKKIIPKPSVDIKTPAERKETLTAQNRDTATGRNIPEKPKKKKKKKEEVDKAIPFDWKAEFKKLGIKPTSEQMKKISRSKSPYGDTDNHKFDWERFYDDFKVPKHKRDRKSGLFDFEKPMKEGEDPLKNVKMEVGRMRDKPNVHVVTGKDKADESYPVFGDDKKKKKKKRTGESAGEREKRELMANLSPAVLANMKRIEALNQVKIDTEKDKNQVRAGKGRGKQIQDKLREDISNIPVKKVPKKKKPKPKKSKFDFFNRGSAGKTFDWDAFWKKHGLKKPEKKEDANKAEENQFGAWGQRGLGDGSGTGAIQGAGDTHLITPVKEEKLNELMRGIRYMPRSVSRKRKQ